MPAGSRPERRRPSRAESLDSTAKLRCTASREAKSTATQNRPAALAGAQLGHGHVAQPAVETKALHGRRDARRIPGGCLHREGDVVGGGEVVVEEGVVTEESDLATDGPPVGAKVVAEHFGLAV